jgi:hypothetical protein
MLISALRVKAFWGWKPAWRYDFSGGSNECCFFDKKSGGVRVTLIYPDFSVVGRRGSSYELTDVTAIFDVAVIFI